MLPAHVERFGTGAGRICRSENGNAIQPSIYSWVWRKTRALGMTPAQRATPLMRRVPARPEPAGTTARDSV
jgi:hypothetical protein